MTGRKVFVSYKYNDNSVRFLWGPKTIVRHYFEFLKAKFEKIGYTWTGEGADEDLSEYKESYIWQKLKDGIFQSSVTVLLISPQMKTSLPEQSQWIHREIEYSLMEPSRSGRTSHSNAIVAVVLPDGRGDDKYAYYDDNFDHFKIVKENIDNKYIEVVTWDDFMYSPRSYIDDAIKRRDDDETTPVKRV